MATTYEDNVLNKFDTYTYKWKVKMVNLQNISQPGIVIAESGVENEISIEKVEHDFKLTFVNANRSPAGNYFLVSLIEANALSLFTRIKVAATSLGIPNSLEAGYELSLKIMARNENGDPVSVPEAENRWITKCFQVDNSFTATGSSYNMLFIEQKETIYETQDHVFNEDVNFDANNIEDFERKLQEQLKNGSETMTARNINKRFPTEYTIKFPGAWRSWQFQVSEEGDGTRMVSDDGSGNIKFQFPSGTSVTQMMSIAILHTKNMRRFPVVGGGFIFDDLDKNTKANIQNLKRFPLWFAFNNTVDFLRFDEKSKSYQRRLNFEMKEYISPELIISEDEHSKVLESDEIQKSRLAGYFSRGLLKKRYDYYYTGLNTEVINFDIQLNSSYYAISPLPINGPDTNFLGNSTDENDTRLQLIQEEIDRLTENPFSTDPRDESGVASRIRQLEQKRASIFRELLEATPIGSNNTTFDRDQYLTQSDLTNESLGKSQDPVSQNLKFHSENFSSLSTQGPDKGFDGEYAAVRLGAVELNANSLKDLLDINITVRGDPYWLGHDGKETNDEFIGGGPCLFLNVNIPTYSENEDITAKTSPDFNIVGLYRIIQVQSIFANGQWEMRLQGFRDLNTNIAMIYKDLQSGEIIQEQVDRISDVLADREVGRTGSRSRGARGDRRGPRRSSQG